MCRRSSARMIGERRVSWYIIDKLRLAAIDLSDVRAGTRDRLQDLG